MSGYVAALAQVLARIHNALRDDGQIQVRSKRLEPGPPVPAGGDDFTEHVTGNMNGRITKRLTER